MSSFPPQFPNPYPSISPQQMNQLLALNATVSLRDPSSSQFFQALGGVYLAFFILAVILTLITSGICMKMILEVFMKIKNEYIQVDLYWLLSTPMTVSWICFLSICFPRSSSILYSIGLAIVVIALSTTCALFNRLYGGRHRLSEYLQEKDRRLEFATRPLCCCCKCLPSCAPSVRNIRLITLLVDQTPFVRLTLAVALIVISLEGSPDTDPVVTTLDIIGVVSTLVAVYAAQIIIELGEDDLDSSGFGLLFKCTNIAQMLYTLMRFILEMLGRNDVFPRLPPLNSDTISGYWFFVAMIGSYFLIALALAKNIRPGRSSFFEDASKPIIAGPAAHERPLLRPANGDEADVDVVHCRIETDV